jgi:RNA polymerase sigma factor (sigma-70 family)
MTQWSPTWGPPPEKAASRRGTRWWSGTPPLVWSICRKHQLGDTDAGNVGQIVWLQLLDHLSDAPRPAALPGWLATTTRRECHRILRAARGPQTSGYAPDADNSADEQLSTTEQELLLAERHAALREAMARLPPRCRQLIAVLIENPPVPDAEISATLGIPIGSIGPSRGRCLDKLRDHPAIAALITAGGQVRTPSDPGQQVIQQAPSANGRHPAMRLADQRIERHHRAYSSAAVRTCDGANPAVLDGVLDVSGYRDASCQPASACPLALCIALRR